MLPDIIQTGTDAQLDKMLYSVYHNLNEKLDALHKCNTVADKNQQKYLLQIKPVAPKLSTLINTH
jgi:hypothetical protein